MTDCRTSLAILTGEWTMIYAWRGRAGRPRQAPQLRRSPKRVPQEISPPFAVPCLGIMRPARSTPWLLDPVQQVPSYAAEAEDLTLGPALMLFVYPCSCSVAPRWTEHRTSNIERPTSNIDVE